MIGIRHIIGIEHPNSNGSRCVLTPASTYKDYLTVGQTIAHNLTPNNSSAAL